MAQKALVRAIVAEFNSVQITSTLFCAEKVAKEIRGKNRVIPVIIYGIKCIINIYFKAIKPDK